MLDFKNFLPRRIKNLAVKKRIKEGMRRAEFKGTHGRLPNFSFAIKETIEVEGAIVEAGVRDGITLGLLALECMVHCPNRPIFAYDSFRGFPPDYVEGDVMAPEENISFLGNVKENLTLARIDLSKITFVEGYFDKTVNDYSGGPIAILHLDVDLGKSYADVLPAFWPHIALGGMVIFDEYDTPEDLEKWPDAKPTIDDFFKDKSFEVIDRPFLTRRIIVRR